MVHTQAESVLHRYTKFEADSLIRSKVIKGSKNLEFGSRDPGHPLWFVRRKGPFSMSVPNLRLIALSVQKL